MVSGSARGGRGGGQIGRAGARYAEEELERGCWVSDAVRIRGSYRYLRHGLQSMPALHRRESRHHRASSSSSAPASRAVPPPRGLNYGATRVNDNEAASSVRPRPVPRFDPGDFVPDDQIPMVAAAFERNASVLTPGDFVHESDPGTVTKLMEEKTHREAEKKEEWRRKQEAQDAKFVEISDDSD